MIDVTKSPTFAKFLVLVLFIFLLKVNVLELATLIYPEL